MYALAVPFDLRCESGTCGNIIMVKIWNATIQYNAWADEQPALMHNKMIIKLE